jgi:hypothetical protein
MKVEQHRSDDEVYKFWSATVTKEPISDNLKELFRLDLIEYWHWLRRENYFWLFKSYLKRYYIGIDLDMTLAMQERRSLGPSTIHR